MTKYLDKKFTVASTPTEKYRSNWEQTFRSGHGVQGEPATDQGEPQSAPPPSFETPAVEPHCERCGHLSMIHQNRGCAVSGCPCQGFM